MITLSQRYRTSVARNHATQWLRERALEPRTREGYEHLLDRYLRPVLGRMPIDTITPSVVRTWWSRLPVDKPTVRARSYD